jgi:hypothetical protein
MRSTPAQVGQPTMTATGRQDENSSSDHVCVTEVSDSVHRSTDDQQRRAGLEVNEAEQKDAVKTVRLESLDNEGNVRTAYVYTENVDHGPRRLQSSEASRSSPPERANSPEPKSPPATAGPTNSAEINHPKPSSNPEPLIRREEREVALGTSSRKHQRLDEVHSESSILGSEDDDRSTKDERKSSFRLICSEFSKGKRRISFNLTDRNGKVIEKIAGVLLEAKDVSFSIRKITDDGKNTIFSAETFVFRARTSRVTGVTFC